MDIYSRTMGSKHRVFFHTPLSAGIAALNSGGAKCIPAALNHLMVDEFYGDPQSYVLLESFRLTNRFKEPKCRVWKNILQVKE